MRWYSTETFQPAAEGARISHVVNIDLLSERAASNAWLQLSTLNKGVTVDGTSGSMYSVHYK